MHELLKMQQSKYLYQVFGQKSVTQKVDPGYCEDSEPRTYEEPGTNKKDPGS